jgi:PleD family two-component response regulator
MPMPDQKTILIIEDSTTQALHLQMLLEGNRLNVEWADTGLKGVDMAQQLLPDLIILDLQLPDINGVQVGERLKNAAETSAIPIILMTRYDDSEMVLEAMEIGIDDYIPKDAFADAVLVETLRQMGLITS